MGEKIIALVSGLALPPEILTFILSALPVTELRASIPVAQSLFGLSAYEAFFWAYLGSLVPALFILFAGEWFTNLKILSRKVEKTRRKFYKKYEKYGSLALVIFVGVPLPLTGVWTGSLAAVLFGIPFRKAFPLIAVGNAIAGMVVTLATVGIINIANHAI